MLRRLVVVGMSVGVLSMGAQAFAIRGFGFHVNINRLATSASPATSWHATLQAYLVTDLDPVWRVETGLGFDFDRLAPSGSIGFLRAVSDDLDVVSNVVLEWIPRVGIQASIDAGIRYDPLISDRASLILETYPIHWDVISVEHRYYPVPTFDPAVAIGGAYLLEHGGFFGETVTIDAYKIRDRRLPFSLFIGNDWYLTAAVLTTRFGYAF
jgi:hypothetical protein